jgi:hypothetical protein
VLRRLLEPVTDLRRLMKAFTDENRRNANLHWDSNNDASARMASNGGEPPGKFKNDASASVLRGGWNSVDKSPPSDDVYLSDLQRNAFARMLSCGGSPLHDALRCWACAGVTLTPDGKWMKYEPRTTESTHPIFDPHSYFISVAAIESQYFPVEGCLSRCGRVRITRTSMSWLGSAMFWG